MTKVVPIITNLTGGEMTPFLDSRVDFKKYQNGCEEMENFMPRPQGAATKRSGTIFANEVENSDLRPRLVPFIFSTIQAYMLEFGEDSSGNGYMRPWKYGAGGYGVITSGASIIKIPAPYGANDLRDIQYTQTADVLYLFHPSYAPQKLTRTSHTAWSLGDAVWGSSMSAPTGGGVANVGTTGSTSYTYQITEKDASGNESLPSSTLTTTTGNATLSTTNYNRITWSGNGATAVEVCVYRGYNGVFKYIGNASPASLAFKDTGQDYDSTITPPVENLPFVGAGNYPRCGSFYQDRLWLGGTNNRPQTIWGSRVGDHQNLNLSRPKQDADSVEFTLLSNEVSVINWMVPGKKVFLLGTAGAEWVLKSSDSGAITPTNVDASPEIFYGCSNMRALPIGAVLLFVELYGKQVLEFAYELASDGYVSPDLMVLSEHLTRDNALAEWAYAQSPHRMVVTVRDDGVSPCLTYFRDHEVVGWWRMTTDGEIESVAVIPGEDRDEVWLVVKRTVNGATKRYVEVLAPAFSNDETCEDAFFVDCGATLDNWNDADTLSIAKRMRLAMASGGSWAVGDSVFMFSSNAGSGAAFNIGYASNVGKRFAFRNADNSISRARATGTTSSAGKLLGKLEAAVPVELQGTATADFAKMVTALSGLTWLEGKTVDLLGDGKKLPSQVVTGGAVTLSQPCAKVHVGLHYEGYITPHPIEAGFQDGTAVGRKARIPRVGLRLYQTYGLKVGPKGGTLSTLNFSTGTAKMDAALVPFSGDMDVALDSNSEASPHIRIVHDEPLPCTILSIVPRIHGTGG